MVCTLSTVLLLYYRRDEEDDLTPIPEPAEKKSYDIRSRSGSLDNFNTTFYRDTPVPAFNYKPKY